MSNLILVPVGEYLATGYRPDRELVNGQLVDRNVGEYDHSNLQGALVAWMRARQREWQIRVLPEQRLRVAHGQYRVPDICVISRNQEIESVFTKPPLLCIEVLSKADSLSSMEERVNDYLVFGVRDIWILDPIKRLAFVFNNGKFSAPENGMLHVTSSKISISLKDLFAELD